VCRCVGNSDANILNVSKTKRFSGSCTIRTLYESACGASIGDVIDDVTLFHDIIIVTSQSSKLSHSETTTRIDCPCGPFKHTVVEHCTPWAVKKRDTFIFVITLANSHRF